LRVNNFEDLIVWQKSHQLAIDVYRVTNGFPEEEKFGIISQIRRAAYSIPSNIVEGHSRKSKKGICRLTNYRINGLTNEV
jgi:four helix bundle protein